MRHVQLPDGTPLPVLGLGTWRMGESRTRRRAEVGAVRAAMELGYRLFDTAEMYGDGGAEEVVGEAIAATLRAGAVAREALCIVSKVYPHNASRHSTVDACERSLKRLQLDHIDLYLLHWRGAHPLRDTVEAMRALVAAGKVRHWGVSNFDVDDLQELADAAGPAGQGCASNQVYYSLGERGPEFALLPRMRLHQMPLMAYSPIDQGRLARDPALATIAAARGITPAQLALAWVCSQPGVIAIPKAVHPQHLRENWAAADLQLSAAEQLQIDHHFSPPTSKAPLAMT